MSNRIICIIFYIGSVFLPIMKCRSGESLDEPQKVRLAILPLKGSAVPGSEIAYFGPAAQSILTTSFARLSGLDLIERERLDDISSELQRQQSDLFDPASRQHLGKLLGVQVILFGSYFVIGNTLRIDARMVEVETGRIIHAEEVTDETLNLFLMIDELVKKFARALESGDILKIKEEERGALSSYAKYSFSMYPEYSDGLQAMDDARVYEREEQWIEARERYTEAQKAFIEIVKNNIDFEPAKTALKRIERKIREIDYIMETGERIPIRMWALIVGIDNYRDRSLQALKYAAADARMFEALIRSPECGSIPAQRIRFLADTNATRENILSHLDYLLKASSEDDVLLIYFAGHGIADAGSFYFLGVDGDKARSSATGLAASQINDMIRKQAMYKKSLWIIDACNAGASGERGERGADETNDLLRSLAKSESGYAILSASNEYQKALEFADKGHGVFTYYLSEGIKGNADIAPSDGYVTVRELIEYTGSHVNKITNGRQTPLCFGCEVTDFPISRVR